MPTLYSYLLSGVDFPLFVIPEGNLRFVRIIKTTSGEEPLQTFHSAA
jgi:hypothetical protein